MSHFTVLVIGEKPEEQLAPYHEFECTGTDDKFIEDVEENLEEIKKEHKSNLKEYDDTSEDLVKFIESWYGKEATTKSNLDLKEKHKYGYCLVGENGEIIKVINRTNPNAKWDWYSLGGRWSGYFKLKKGKGGKLGERSLMEQMQQEDTRLETDSDVTKKGDVDWKAMKKEGNLSTFAVVKDGKWYEKGEMGWFACVANKKEEKVWEKEFEKLVMSLTDDTLLSLYDCHI